MFISWATGNASVVEGLPRIVSRPTLASVVRPCSVNQTILLLRRHDGASSCMCAGCPLASEACRRTTQCHMLCEAGMRPSLSSLTPS